MLKICWKWKSWLYNTFYSPQMQNSFPELFSWLEGRIQFLTAGFWKYHDSPLIYNSRVIQRGFWASLRPWQWKREVHDFHSENFLHPLLCEKMRTWLRNWIRLISLKWMQLKYRALLQKLPGFQISVGSLWACLREHLRQQGGWFIKITRTQHKLWKGWYWQQVAERCLHWDDIKRGK